MARCELKRWTTSSLLLTAVLLGGLAPGVAAQAPEAAGLPNLPTPELLEHAVDRGAITPTLGDVLLALALGDRARYLTIPGEFQSDTPWDGTLPLLNLRRRVEGMPDGPSRVAIEEALSPPPAPADAAASTESMTCGTNTITTAAVVDSSYFHILGSTSSGPLTAADYGSALDGARSTQVDSFGWPAPPFRSSAPPPGGRYPVAILELGGGLYGYSAVSGTYSGSVGNNPNTAWNDSDASATCLALSDDFNQFGDAQKALDATAAHEYNHAIQFGYGALAGTNVPDASFIEGGATWMEDETFDTANDNYNYLWPDFTQGLGDYDGSPYRFWLMIRGLTERFGTGAASGGEQVVQDFWEETSKNTGNNLSALATALSRRGVPLATAFHDFAIAAAFMRACGGSYVLPHCFEEASGYKAKKNGVLPPVQGSISALGSTFTGAVEDDFATSWITLPTGAGFSGYTLKLTNTSGGGQLRASAVCDTGTALVRSPFPVVGAGVVSTLTPVRTTGCLRAVAVVTNETQSTGNPAASGTRSYTLTAQAGVPPATDFNGDGKTEIAVFRPSTGAWYVQGGAATAWGANGDVPVPGDYNGDGRTEIAVFRPSTGAWYVQGGATTAWGANGDVPVPGDYNGDGKTEIAVFRPSTGAWYVQGGATTAWGANGDVPVPGDYSGDGKTDIAVFRPSTGAWYVHGGATTAWGANGDVPVPGYYDGDADIDIAVFRPSSGVWYVRAGTTTSWGTSGDIPVPGDYDGNGSTVIAVFRPSTGLWYLRAGTTTVWGTSGDTALPLPFAIRRSMP